MNTRTYDTVKVLSLTVGNVADVLLPGDRFADDPYLPPVKSVRATWDGHDNAKVTFTDGTSDILGLPQTVRVTRTVTAY